MIVLCFSSVDPSSYCELESVIWPDLNQRFPGVPLILVATKCDARADEKDVGEEGIWQIDTGDSPPKSKLHFVKLFKMHPLVI